MLVNRKNTASTLIVAARALAAVLCAWLLPTAVFAQASIAGIVKDASGAVLPGVTVEASSPELIEKVRSAITDGSGQYKIVDLRPGVYAVTFTLAGFTSEKRQGIELSGTFVATVNADLKVGSVEETITVTGETPVVDVQSSKQQTTISGETISAIPTARLYSSIATLVPGVTSTATQDVGGLAGPAVTFFAARGSRQNDTRLQLDGLSVSSPASGGSVSYYVVDVGNSQEVAFSISGNLGEAQTAGPVMNVVPRQGGNSFKGNLFANGATDALQTSNFTEALQDRGLRAPNLMQKIWDVNGSFGGPVVRDKLWFSMTGRYQGNRKLVAGMYQNLNAGNPDAWTYAPDLSRQATDDGTWKNASGRLTWQTTPRNKVNAFWDEQALCTSCIGGGTATVAPEAAGNNTGYPLHVQQVTWSSPQSQRLLLEAGIGTDLIRWGGFERPGAKANRSLIRVVEQGGAIPGLTYRAPTWMSNWSGVYTWRASATYVMGAQSLKVGYFGGFLDSENSTFDNTNAAYRFLNSVPNQLTQTSNPFLQISHYKPEALYAQDQWTKGRLTLQGGIRYDHFSSTYPDQFIGVSKFVPVQVDFPAQEGVVFNDISPRGGAAFDLFGTGRTAVKVSFGKYMQTQDGSGLSSSLNPLARATTSVTRTWNDRNNNFVPDCDLLNPAAQTVPGGDICGLISNANFGTSTLSNTTFDPAIANGWGVRPNEWDFGVGIQQELLPRVSLDVSYLRRWYGNFAATDNLSVAPSDFTKYNLTAPVDPRLPGGGGYAISGLRDVSLAKFGQVANFVTAASNYGNQTEHWDSLDINVNARLRSLTFQGGTSTGRAVTDNCEIVAILPELLGTTPESYCHISPPFKTQFRGLASYNVPRIDVQVSGTFQSLPGATLAANFVASNAFVAPALGRNLSAGANGNITVNLITPSSLYGDRINQLDIRATKVFKFSDQRVMIGADLYNALNSSAIQTYNQSFTPGGSWLVPTLILPARFAKITAQFQF